MPQLPKQSDIPSSLSPVFHPSLASNSDSSSINNIILFLPGLGDTSVNFSSFARALNLPESLCITLQPPFPLPFPLGPTASMSSNDQAFSWARPEDLLVDSTSGELDSVESKVDDAVSLIAKNVVVDMLLKTCGWAAQQIHLFGFGMGGTVALRSGLEVDRLLRQQQKESVQELPTATKTGSSSSTIKRVLGGIMSIGGPLPLRMPLSTSSTTENSAAMKNKIPVILLAGLNSPTFRSGDGGESVIKRIRDRFEFVEFAKWKKNTNSMPSNRDEVLPMMRFWGRTLKSRKGVLKGAVEIS